MAIYTERIQTVLTTRQHERLIQLAERTQKPISVLVREAIEQTYFTEIERHRRQNALQTLLALEAPVADWPEMEAEIARGAVNE